MQNSEGHRWGHIFLETSSKIPYQDRLELLAQAVEMHLAGETQRDIKNKDYECRLCTENKYAILGTFSGIEYTAKIETNGGQAKIRFIINEQTFLSPISAN